MRIAKFWTIVALAASAALPFSGASAQEPPQLQKLEEGEKPNSTIPGGGVPQTEITQTRQQGKVNEVEVSRGKNTYILKPNTPAGSSIPGDAQASNNRGAQWKVMQFNLSSSEEKRKAAAKAALEKQPATPPPEIR
ncbi:MAG: hypothetical protein ACRYGK_17500 [Janthinobacterium lividum]